MDRSFSYEMIRLYMNDMDRVIEKIRLEHQLACNQHNNAVMVRLADGLIQLGTRIKLKFQPKESGCYKPQMFYRER